MPLIAQERTGFEIHLPFRTLDDGRSFLKYDSGVDDPQEKTYKIWKLLVAGRSMLQPACIHSKLQGRCFLLKNVLCCDVCNYVVQSQ